MAINLDELTELENSGVFKLEKLPRMPYEEKSKFVAGLTFEMNLDVLIISRTGYTVLDMFSDVGGI